MEKKIHAEMKVQRVVSFDFSDISSHLLRAVDTEEDFPLISLPHFLSSVMSLYISPTMVYSHPAILSAVLYSARLYTQLQL